MKYRKLQIDDEGEVGAFFSALDGEKHFQPHEMTRDDARAICGYTGRDGYYGGFDDLGTMVVYGILRGWDAGFEHPSLGIVVHESVRGVGHGREMMDFLHHEALREGAKRIRLRVHPDNQAARSLYENLGYRFDGEIDRGQLVGWYHLDRQPRLSEPQDNDQANH